MSHTIMPLNADQEKVLNAVVKDTRAFAPPMLGRIARLVQVEALSDVLMGLQEAGYLARPYKHGPWIPLQTPEGLPLRLKLIEGVPTGDIKQLHTAPTIPDLPTCRVTEDGLIAGGSVEHREHAWSPTQTPSDTHGQD